MDRLAFENMTSKGKSRLSNRTTDRTFSDSQMRPVDFTNELPQSSNPQGGHGQSGGMYFDRYARVTGSMTNKSKMNTNVDNYHLERQSKNTSEYNNYVNALNNNIREDQDRTQINNARLQSNMSTTENQQRIYHPSLLTADPTQRNNFTELDRQSVGTRNRREDLLARNRNVSHIQQSQQPQQQNDQSIPMGPPRLNYPQGPAGYSDGSLAPLEMDMTSHLDMQFQGLTDPNLNQQIQRLQQQNNPTQDFDNIYGNTPLSRRTHFQSDQQQQPGYNPHADHRA